MEKTIEIREWKRKKIPSLDSLVKNLNSLDGVSECRITRDNNDPKKYSLQVFGDNYNITDIYTYICNEGYAIIPATKIKMSTMIRGKK